VDGAEKLGSPPPSSLVMIGNFDGVHRGHRAILLAGAEHARRHELVPLVLTFEPHPHEVLSGARHVPLSTISYRVELIGQLDSALRVVVEPFTLELAAASPRQFVLRLLVQQLGARVVSVGENFRFGAGRSGDLSTLRALGQELGFETLAEPLVGDALGAFSSSRARAALAAGDLASVESILGRPHCVSGTVVAGDGRGRTLGAPTANLSDVPELLPPNGVYACFVDRLDAAPAGSGPAAGVVNIGVRPTVGSGPRSVEVHLLDVQPDLYACRLRVHLVEWLRGEQGFSNLQSLRAQIERDVEHARAVIRSRQR
jgi:riboflavin kinase/FMN adenylyltransferase